MQNIFEAAGIKFWFMDEMGGLCCGRPMMLAGHHEQASVMIEKNRKLISDSGAQTLVTSCPICYKVFAKDYNLNIRTLHHTQYLLELADKHKISLEPLNRTAVYHDPCELSRDVRIYDEPRMLLKKILRLNSGEYEKDNSLCCGSSLANISASNELRNVIARDVYNRMNTSESQYMVTSCPMCKKAFEKVSEVPVKDISEIVNLSLVKAKKNQSCDISLSEDRQKPVLQPQAIQ
jgi:Fe-S oxidoreductase